MRIIYFLILIFVFVSCKNQYSKYGDKNVIESNYLNQPIYNGDGQDFNLRFINNSYNIDNRMVIVSLDTTIIYRGIFSMNSLPVRIPEFYINKSFRPNLMIVEPSLKEGYYFENKDGLDLTSNDSIINIEFTKSKDFYNHIIFKVSN